MDETPTRFGAFGPSRYSRAVVIGITTARILLGSRLKASRRAAKISIVAAAGAIGKSTAHISHIETGRNAPSNVNELVTLIELYGAPDLDELQKLFGPAAKTGWWTSIQGGLPEWFVRYLGLESDACTVRAFETLNIHGLCQTEGFMRFKAAGGAHRLTPREIDKRVVIRQHRQLRLTEDPKLTLIMVVCENALELCAHAGALGLDQLMFLRQRADLPHVDFRVLPTGAGLHPGLDGPFSLLEFPDGVLAPMAYAETPVDGFTVSDPDVVGSLRLLFDQLLDRTLGREDSLETIKELMMISASERKARQSEKDPRRR